jgi:hypothetical protein
MEEMKQLIADTEATLAPYFKAIEETAFVNLNLIISIYLVKY